MMESQDPKNTLDRGSNFKLERYKYILQEIRSLNENVHKYLTLFQTLATAIVGGGVGIFLGWQSLKITADIARIGILTLLSFFTILALFVIVEMLSGIFSWIDYRKEEVDLLNEEVRAGFRQSPNIHNFWRWYETYIIIFIIMVVVFTHIFVRNNILPVIQ